MSLVGPRPEDPIRRPSRRASESPDPPRATRHDRAVAAGVRERGEVLDPDDRISDYVTRSCRRRSRSTASTPRRSIALDVRILSWTAVRRAVGRDVAVNRETGRLTRARPGGRAASRSCRPLDGKRRSDDISDRSHALHLARGAHGRIPVPAVCPAVHAAVLAGGRGTRLAPFTSILPKPLMPIGDRSILEIVIAPAGAAGITEVTLCVGYLSHLIRAVLETTSTAPSASRTCTRRTALGTAGPLRLVPGLDAPFVVMNGDVLTTLDYQDARIEHHRESGNLVTIATRERTIKIDYGVLHLTDGVARRVTGYEREARDGVDRQHGDLRARARGAGVHPGGLVLRFPGPRPRAAGRRRARRRVPVRRPLVRHRSPGRLQRAINVWLEDEEQANGNGYANRRGNGHVNGNGHVTGNGDAVADGTLAHDPNRAAPHPTNGNGSADSRPKEASWISGMRRLRSANEAVKRP